MYPGSDKSTPMNEGGRLLADRYRLLEKVGEGGAAEVFRAKDQRLDRIVAVKLLRPQYTHDQASRQRFIQEAKASASLSHANIVDIYDFGEAPDGSMFIAMQYIEGQNLKDILQKRGRLTAEETISITRQACYALSAAHARGMVHRDVKPQNIMIDRKGNAHLTDFGIVKALSGPSLTQSGMTFGTAAYMSPEQATGAPVGPTSDIYSLGCVMYEALAGTPPFMGDNPAVVAYKQVWEQPRPLHELVPEVPPSLESMVMRCLNKDSNRRYPDTEALAADLDAINVAFSQPTQAVSLGSLASAPRPSAQWMPAGARPSAEMSQPVPIPAQSQGGVGTVPVARAQTPAYGSVPVPQVVPPVRSAGPYTGPAEPPRQIQTVDVTTTRRSIGWMPIVLLTALGLILLGFALWQGRNFLNSPVVPGVPTPSPTVTELVVVPTSPPQVSPTLTSGAIIQESPTPLSTEPISTDTPTAVPTAAPTDTPEPTPVPPTDTPVPVVPTDTPEPLPPPTETPEVPPSPTPEPPPLEDPSPTPEEVPVEPPGSVQIEDNSFSGGYTNANRRYQGVTSVWVYGRSTQYHTMSASFNIPDRPRGPGTLTIRGQDSEDRGKTPIVISLNDTVVYAGDNPLPDSTRGPSSPGNWGTFSWRLDPGTLRQGANTITISHTGVGCGMNCPGFFMLDYAIVSW